MAAAAKVKIWAAAAFAAVMLGSAGAQAAQCGNDASGFPAWLEQFKGEAQSQGISASTLNRALGNVSYDRKVISLDRNQKSFKLSLNEFMARRAPASYVKRAKGVMRQNAALLQRIEQRYGVQPEVLMAIWGMETGFGANSGNMNIFRSLATLSYDCRRSDFFTEELLAALQIVQRGDKTPEQMKGAWAGEIGQTQFLAKNYLRYAVDFDGDGRRDLISSKADVLASTANFLAQHGWQPGAGYEQGQPNYRVFADWNRATVYQQALALFASQIAN
ncbi:lytic murein transglycosylase [Mesorhizobium sp. RP14(2022)]|jgi:lytic murein transglycosylase|uniref:Lytic murein transglycosylase n=1 Tax=Mesorhizobium liriopis TaxID=2953882 RepID=A0ABT1C4I3_9HYPH|nr:lytic murein transglycosylase [Mesorhizobium liriopis]MCO6048861.1 lytic murein transglycosylase [Mesorhizobium liriopis]